MLAKKVVIDSGNQQMLSGSSSQSSESTSGLQSFQEQKPIPVGIPASFVRKQPEKQLELKASGFYQTKNVSVQIYRNGKAIGRLIPQAIVRLTKCRGKIVKKENRVAVSYPMPFCSVRVQDLNCALDRKECVKELKFANPKDFLRKREKMVKWIGEGPSSFEVQGDLLDFVCELLNEHEFIDVSLKEGSIIAEYCQNKIAVDFREFELPKQLDHVAMFINLPWFYRQQLNDFLDRMLEVAEKENILLDVVVLNHWQRFYKKKSWHRQLNQKCFSTWVWNKVKFFDPEKNRDWKLKRGKAFCGLVTNGDEAHRKEFYQSGKFLVEDLQFKTVRHRVDI